MMKKFLVAFIASSFFMTGASHGRPAVRTTAPLAQWHVLGDAGFSLGEATYQSVALAADGKPYVAYQDGALQDKTTVMRFNGSTWETVGQAGFSAGKAFYQSLAIAAESTPYVAYQDNAQNNKTTVMYYNGSAWKNVGPAGFSRGEAFNHHLVINSEGRPQVIYQEKVRGRAGERIQTIEMVYNGTQWVAVRPGSALSVQPPTNPTFPVMLQRGARQYEPSMVTTPDGAFFVLTQDERKGNKAVVRMTNDGGHTWKIVGNAGFSSGEATYLSLAVTPAYTPDNVLYYTLYAAYKDASQGNRTTVMKY